MKRSYDIIDELLELLTDNPITSESFTVIKGFEPNSLPIPIPEVYLSLVPDSVSVTYYDNENEEYCERTKIVIRLNCFVPLQASGSVANEISEGVLDYINDRYPESVTEYSVGEIDYDSNIRAYKQTSLVTFTFEQCAAENSDSDELTVPKNFFCKTHVLDSDIHVSGAEKELINYAFSKGEYSGTGSESSQEVIVGFPARYVIVYRKSYHPSVYDSSSGKVICYTAYAFSGALTRGITMTSIGFTVKNVSDSAGETRLNEANATYAYIAYK